MGVLGETGYGKASGMKLSSLLLREHVLVGLSERTLEAAVGEILRRLEIEAPCDGPGPQGRSGHGEIAGWKALRDAVWTRERQSSTALERGVAIPHARMPGLREYIVLLGITETPLEDRCLDGSPVRVVFIILGNEQKNALMLQTMAAIGELTKDEALLERLCGARSAREAWHIVDSSGVQVRPELRARDLMKEAPARATGDMLMRDLLDLFFVHSVRVIPVCNEGEKVTGAVTSAEIVEAGFPEYMAYFDNIGFLDELESFHRFFRQENTVRVAEILNAKPLVFDAATPLIQVVFRMNRERLWYAFVEQDGRLIGMIDRHDIITRLLRL